MKPKTDQEIDKAFAEIERSFQQIGKKHKQELDEALIKPIHEKYLFAQNGITALIASMGSGKSYNYLKSICKQEVLFDEPFYELVVICSTSSKFDKTVETYKTLIKKSKLVCVKDTDLLDWLNKYMRRILKYNSINEHVKSNFKVIPEELQRSFNKHGLAVLDENHINPQKKEKRFKYISEKLIKYNWKTVPHRCLLILDDFANHPLLRSKETEMSRLLKKLRHFNINVIICVQTCKSIPKDIKRILSDIILFPGIGLDDFKDLMKESPASMFDMKTLWNEYNALQSQHDMFTIHLKAKKIVITPSNFNDS